MGLNKDIIRLSLPAIVSNITVPLLGLCDTGISGHLGSERYLAAIAVGSMMLNVVFWLFGFLRMGTTGLTANAYGNGKDDEISSIFTRSLTLALGLGILLVIFREPLLNMLLIVVNAEPEVSDLVRRYFLVSICEAPAMLSIMAVSGWFVGMQSTLWPMVIAISVNVINIIISFMLVFHFQYGFEGVAWGTLMANWMGFVAAMIAAIRFRKGKKLFVNPAKVWKGGEFGKFFTVNVNLFFRSFCIISVSLGVTAAGARLGALILAVNAVMMQFFTFFSFFMDGFAFSAEALTGKWYGSGNIIMVRKVVKTLLKWSLGVASAFTLVYIGGYSGIVEILTNETSVQLGVEQMRIWLWILPIISVWAFIYDGFYVGITDTSKMMCATLFSSVIFYFDAFTHISEGSLHLGVVSNNMLWSAFIAYLLLRGVILASIWPHELKKKFSS